MIKSGAKAFANTNVVYVRAAAKQWSREKSIRFQSVHAICDICKWIDKMNEWSNQFALVYRYAQIAPREPRKSKTR